MGRLKHLTTDAQGNTHTFEGTPPLRVATITNLRLDMKNAYFLYPEDAGQLKSAPTTIEIKWRGVSVPSKITLMKLIEDKLWASKKIKAKVLSGTFALNVDRCGIVPIGDTKEWKQMRTRLQQSRRK